jgi:hypothetical protein
MSDCSKFPPKTRLRAICDGSAGWPESKREVFLAEHGIEGRKPVARTAVAVARTPRPSTGKSCCGGGIIQRTARKLVMLKAAAVDFVSDGMAVATEEQQAKRSAICAACPLNINGWCDDTKGGCGCNLSLKVQPRSSSCPLGKWSAYRDDYRPLVNPTRSLIFHVYPLKRRRDWWMWHVSKINQCKHLFNGRVVIGVVVGPETDSAEDVQREFERGGIRVDEWVIKQNSKLAETLTQVELFRAVMTDDPNAIVFRSHCKGITKQQGAVEEDWARIMWDANMDMPTVEDSLASHLVACVLRSQTPLVKKKPGGWFAAGSAYWFRAKEAFERDWAWSENNRWAIEYWPAHVFSLQESACMFHDLVPSSVLDQKYFDEHVNPEFAIWKAAREIK